jgi:membrane protein insertase Oxa1/YidC/SpoIIIJ
VSVPQTVSTAFFGIINLLTPHHILLALLVGVTQYLAIRFTIGRTPISHAPGSDKAAVAKMQQNMMLYFMPAIMAITSYYFAAAIGIYFVASNVFSLGQEMLISKQLASAKK